MKDCAIIGSGIMANLVRKQIEGMEGGRVVAFIVEKDFIDQNETTGIPVLCVEDYITQFAPNSCNLYMGIGYKAMGNIREKLFRRFKEQGYCFENLIHPSCIISQDLEMGEGNILLENVVVETGCRIGDANLFFAGCVIGHDSTIGNYVTMSVRSCCAGEVKIQDHCFLGASSTVRNKVIIGEYTLIGASAYAYNNTPQYAVVRPPKSEIDTTVSSLDFV